MASSARVELDSKGIEQLLKSAGVTADLERRAAAVAKAAGPGMRHRVYQGKDRARATVWTGTSAAKRAETNDRALTRAIDAARR